MADIFLNKSTHDIDINNGRLRLNSDKAEAVAQKVKVALLTFKGEWFLNTKTGLPYFQTILKKPSSKLFIDSLYKEHVRKIDGVERVIDFTSELDSRNRKYTISKLRILIRNGEEVTVSFP